MDLVTERIARAAMYVGVTGCSMVVLLLLVTSLQQLVLPDSDPMGIQVLSCLVGLALGIAWTRTVGRRWSGLASGKATTGTPGPLVVYLDSPQAQAKARGGIARRR